MRWREARLRKGNGMKRRKCMREKLISTGPCQKKRRKVYHDQQEDKMSEIGRPRRNVLTEGPYKRGTD
jgi:hypothetical protein